MTAVGCTGHQSLTAPTRAAVAAAVAAELADLAAGAAGPPLVGLSALAAGADQIFAHALLAAGGSLVAVVPSAGYETTLGDPADAGTYRALLGLATETVVLPYGRPTEEAFLAAGLAVVDRADVLIAVWDGNPAAGPGGTADVVAYANSNNKPVRVVWPDGASRG